MRAVSQARLTEQQVAERLVGQVKSEGVDLVGADGLLSDLTKAVLEAARELEVSEHLGINKHVADGRNLGNSRNACQDQDAVD